MIVLMPIHGLRFGKPTRETEHNLHVRKLPYRKRGINHDSQTVIGRISALSAQENPQTGKRRNLGTFATRGAAEKHEREVQYFKRH